MVLVFLADGFEEVEAVTPADYLLRCGLDVKTVGVRGKMVKGSHGLTVIADWTMYDVDLEKTEMIVLPGGQPGTQNLAKSRRMEQVILHCVQNNILIGAICAAPSILGEMGLLEGRRATCFPGYEDTLKGARVTGNPVETDGIFITSRGAGTANQFAFALVEAASGREAAQTLKDTVQWRG